MDRRALTEEVRGEAQALGFDAVGFAAVDGPADPEGHLQRWLDLGRHGLMGYMARTAEERADVRRIVPEARSVVVLAMSYYRPEYAPAPPLEVSRYAVGRDYHTVIRKRIRRLRRAILSLEPDAVVKPTVDTSPVLEREWARRAGVGWTGKSTMSLSQTLGTYFFLATLITDLEFEWDAPVADRCGSCTRCLDACPTDAFVAPYQLDARRCITTWNVEDRSTPQEDLPELHGWVAGCDVCQEVCPWNKFARPTTEPAFVPVPERARPDPDVFVGSPTQVAEAIQGSALQRTGAEAMVRNARRILGVSRFDSVD